MTGHYRIDRCDFQEGCMRALVGYVLTDPIGRDVEEVAAVALAIVLKCAKIMKVDPMVLVDGMAHVLKKDIP